MAFLHKLWTPRIKPALLVIFTFAVMAILATVVISSNRPKPVALADPQAQAIAAVLRDAERLLGEVACNPSLDVDVLDGVLADSPIHRPVGNTRDMVVQVYGESAAEKAGFLTNRKAYYLTMRGDYLAANATPENGLRPTSRPGIYCPTPTPDVVLSIQSIAIGPDRAVASYRVANYALKEATLINAEGRWKIADLKYLERNN